MKKFTSLLIVGFIFVGLVGCGNNQAKTPAPKTTKISMVGSTSVDPLAQKLTEAYKAKKPDVNIEIQAVGSGAGIKAATDGTADIGMSSRELTKEEIASGLNPVVIAHDGIAVVINPKNPIQGLTLKQITDIFMGKIKNWKEVGGEDKDIIVVSRESGSGARSSFEELAKVQVEKDGKKISGLYEKALQAEGQGAVKSNISSKDNAIGYISLGYVDESVKSIEVDGVKDSVENSRTKKYPLVRPFILLTKGAPSPEAKAFMDFVLSDEGQQIAAKDNYITIAK